METGIVLEHVPRAVPVFAGIFMLFLILISLIVTILFNGMGLLQDFFQGGVLLGARPVNVRADSKYNYALCPRLHNVYLHLK